MTEWPHATIEKLQARLRNRGEAELASSTTSDEHDVGAQHIRSSRDRVNKVEPRINAPWQREARWRHIL